MMQETRTIASTTTSSNYCTNAKSNSKTNTNICSTQARVLPQAQSPVRKQPLQLQQQLQNHQESPQINTLAFANSDWIDTQRDNGLLESSLDSIVKQKEEKECAKSVSTEIATTSAGGEANNNSDDGDYCSDALPIIDVMDSLNGNITLNKIKIEIKHKIILDHEKQN